MTKTDWGKYVGLPYHPIDFNCWDLCRLVYFDVFDVVLSKQQASGDDIRGIMASFKTSPEFNNWQQVDFADPYDLILYGMGKSVHHVGIQTDLGFVLHCVKGLGSILSDRKHIDMLGYRQVSTWRRKHG